MSKMTVIQLLNKIANGKEIPKKIKYQNYIYEYQHRRDTENCFNYMCNENGEYLSRRYFIDNILNDDVEVIEEDKKINYPILHKTAPSETTGDQMPNFRKLIDVNFEHLNKTIYQLIDEINDLKEKKK